MKERKTQKPLGGQMTFGLQAEERKGNFGLALDSRDYRQAEGKPDLSRVFFTQPNVGKRERMAFTPAIEFWKNKYKDAIMNFGLDEETGWNIYAEFHFSTVNAVNKMLKRVERGVAYGEEINYSDINFFRKMLLSPTIRQERAYYLGLVCLRMPKTLQDFKSFAHVGLALLEKAENMAPKNPKYKLALWRENDMALERRRKLRKDAAKDDKRLPYQPKPKLITSYNAQEVFEETSFGYYQGIIDHWTQVLVEMSQENKLDLEGIKEEHKKRVESAKKMLMNDALPGTRRQRYDIGFFETLDINRLSRFELYFFALIALYAPYASDAIELEKKAWKLFEINFGKYHNPRIAWVAAFEASRIMVERHIQRKSIARSNELHKIVNESRGAKPMQIPGLKASINKINDSDKLPF